MSLTSTKYSKSYLVILCSVVYFVSYFSRKDFAAVMAGMLQNGAISDKTVGGFIGMGLFICYGIGQLVSGFLGDKLKPSYLILFGLGTTALCNGLMPLMPNGYAMIPVWAVNGFAQAMLWPPIVRILSDNLDNERFVKANLIVTSAAHISTILLYLYVPLCLKYFNWETVFFSASVLTLVAILGFVLSLILILPSDAIKTPTKRVRESDNSDVSYFSLARRTGILSVFACTVMMGILRDGIETWLPTLYAEAFNRDAKESILISVSLPIFSILSIVVITALHKTKTFKNEILGSCVLFSLVILITTPVLFLITMSSFLPRIICLVLVCAVCACMHGVNFLLISCLPGRFAEYGKAATTSGFCNAFTYVGAAISSYGFALISKVLGWRATTLSWMIVSALGVLFTLISLKRYTTFIKQNKE